MIIREDINDIAVVRLSHGKVSALDVEFCSAIVDVVHSIALGSSRALILTGTGSAFSAGVDLFQVLNGGRDYLARFLPAMERLFLTLLEFPAPVIAAINGHAIAGGCIMAAACDYRIMADGNGRIGIPELAVGVPFPTLPFEIVRARVAPNDFRQLVLSARTVLPPEALRLGLVDEIAAPDALMSRAEEAADRLMAIPAIAFELTKRTFNQPILERLRNGALINAAAIEAWSSDGVQSRMRAYVEQTVGKK